MSKYKDGISVIVTLFNKEEYILACLKSAINQFKNSSEKYQIIVVDDGSFDSSFKIAKDFQVVVYNNYFCTLISKTRPKYGFFRKI